MTATHGNRAQLLQAIPPNVAFSNQALTDSGDHLTFNCSAIPTKRYWDRTASFVFQQSSNGTAWNTVSPSVIQYVGGLVMFPSAAGGTNQARIASGAYLPVAALGDILEWAPDIDRDMHESTCMTTNNVPTKWRTYKPGLPGGNIKVSKFLADDTYADIITLSTDDLLILSLVMDATTGLPRFESYAKLAKDGMKVSLSDLEMEDLDFKIDGQFYLVTS